MILLQLYNTRIKCDAMCIIIKSYYKPYVQMCRRIVRLARATRTQVSRKSWVVYTCNIVYLHCTSNYN